jgi:hypothetical protein
MSGLESKDVLGMVARKKQERASADAVGSCGLDISDRGERAGEGTELPSKKDQVLSLFASGITDVEELARITDSRPSYVTSVLQDCKLMEGYFDLYTSTAQPMNVYSKFFARKTGFQG